MRCMVVANEVPWPLDHGGRLHVYELCRRWATAHALILLAPRRSVGPPVELPFEVVTTGRQDAPAAGEACSGVVLNRFERYFGADPAFVAEVQAWDRRWRPDVVIGMGYRAVSCLARLPWRPTVADIHDDEVLYLFRELTAGRPASRWSTLKSLVAMAGFLRRGLRRVDAVCVLAEADARFCRRYTGHPRVVCVPHGVDTDHYAPLDQPADPLCIAFWGALDFGPNASAVWHFARHVWPRVRSVHPSLRWLILGPGDSPLLAEARRTPGIVFTGRVEDIRPYVARAVVAVVPMISGSGIKNKIMEAWAMARPVLCTRRALGSLPGIHGENVWLADSPAEQIEGLIRLLGDPALRTRLGRAGRTTVLEHCSWERAAARYLDLFEEVMGQHPAGGDLRPAEDPPAGRSWTAGGRVGGGPRTPVPASDGMEACAYADP